jgi:hypothetical protein
MLVLLFIGLQKRSLKYLGFALVPQLIPLLQLVMLLQRTTIPLLRYFMTNILFGAFLLAMAVGALRKEYKLTGVRHHLVLLAAALIFLASNVATAWTLDNYPYQNMEQQTWRGLVTSDMVEDIDFTDSYKIGQALPALVEPGSRVLVDTYQFGFGVMLGSMDPSLFMDFTDPNYDEAILDPVEYVDYLLVPNTEGRGALYSINQEHPQLHAKGASWATLVDELPESSGDWRLYRVKR